MNRTTTKCDEVNPIITFKNELKRIFEEKFSGKIGTNFSPFFTRIEENFDGKTGVLFVGKADNIEGRPQSIEAAFSQINGDLYSADCRRLFRLPQKCLCAYIT